MAYVNLSSFPLPLRQSESPQLWVLRAHCYALFRGRPYDNDRASRYDNERTHLIRSEEHNI